MLEVNHESASLTLSVRYEDWDQLLTLDLDQDGLATSEELQARAAEIDAHIRAAVLGWNNNVACAPTITGPALGTRHNNAYVTSVISFDCTGPIADFRLRYHLFAREHPGHRLLTNALIAGQQSNHVFLTSPDTPAEQLFSITAPRSAVAVLGEFALLGVEHVLLGFDHVLFLLALILVGRSLMDLIKLATVFTLAHTVTLALAALGVVSIPAAIVEPAIALSIVVVATENVVFGDRFAGVRLWAALLFGLVHGFGFAGVLVELNPSRESTLVSLAGFNIGVEIGQVAIVSATYPLLYWLQRQSFRAQVVRNASALVGVVGIWWLFERMVGVL